MKLCSFLLLDGVPPPDPTVSAHGILSFLQKFSAAAYTACRKPRPFQ